MSRPGPERDAALAELRALLSRGLTYALAQYSNVTEADIEDFTQDALLKVLDGLDSFRGESRFTTWAHRIAVHVAFTELRRRRWHDVSLDQIAQLADGELGPEDAGPGSLIRVEPEVFGSPAQSEKRAIQSEILRTLRQAIAEELTEKQRQALVAVRLHGIPMDVAARHLGTNRNALYKLLFDARQRLKRRLLAKGLSSEEILSAFES